MKRRKFLGLSAGSVVSAVMSSSASGKSGMEQIEYRAIREADGEIRSAPAPFPIGLHAELPLPKNGRQLARRNDGLWFFVYASYTHLISDRGQRSAVGREGAYTGETEIRMRASRLGNPLKTGDFRPEEVLVRRPGGTPGPTPRSRGHVIAGVGGADVGTQPSMVIDPQDVLHLVWVGPQVGEVWYARCDVSGPRGSEVFQRTENWRHADGRTIGAERIGQNDARLGDICLDGQGRPCVLYQNEDGVFFARYENGRWRQRLLAEGPGRRWPIMACDRAGVLHVVWVGGKIAGSAHPEVYGGLLQYLRSEDGGFRWTGADGKTSQPDFIGGYCHEAPSLAVSGEHILVPHYQRYRVVTFSHYDGEKWITNTVLPVSYDHNSPMLTVDRHDVIWMHMVNRPHDWSRMCRWLGDGWSDLQEGRRLQNLANACSAERVMPKEAVEFGLILADKSHRLYFDTIAVPAPAARKGQHVMFLDLWDVAGLNGVQQVVEPMQKDPSHPVLKHGNPGDWDATQANLEGTVLKDGARYRMWYTGLDKKPWFPFRSSCGYAESTDGVNWHKPKLGLYSFRGSKENNICFDSGFVYAVLKMPEEEVEPNSSRRYRMAFNAHKGASLAFSPDGIHWTPSEDNPLWTGGRAGEFDQNVAENSTYLYDPHDPDPERRFKAYPQTGGAEKGRTVGLMVSPDGIHFKRYANNPVIDADLGVEKQLHYVKVWWRRHGVVIGLYGCYLDNVNLDARLIVSRDGIHWVRVKNEVPFLSTGEPGSWDAGMVFPANYPIVEGEDVWIYYSGFELNFAGAEGHASVGRARVRLDGFARMELRPGRTNSTLTTIPLEVRDLEQVRLVVNADHLEPRKRWLRVEILDGKTKQPLPGFAVGDCNPLTTEGLAVPVSWRSGARLSQIRAESIRLRFHFFGVESSPRLYSFGFE